MELYSPWLLGCRLENSTAVPLASWVRCAIVCSLTSPAQGVYADAMCDRFPLPAELALDKSTVPEQQVAIKFIERGEKVWSGLALDWSTHL